jgi:NADPH:quinone reductase-like Zn-dependent oxidoreductase
VNVKAAVYDRYGPPEVLVLRDVDTPTPGDTDILVRVRAAAVTMGDIRMRKADPFTARLYNGLFKPIRVKIPGFSLAGDVAAVGRTAQRFKPGDPVYGFSGFSFGGYAEFKRLPANNELAIKPANMSYEQAAAVPYGALAALHYLRDAGHIQPGQRVLILGASGSVGTFAVQLANWLGAEVTGVCSARNAALVTSLGAADTIDYRTEDFTARGGRYDLIFDAAGKSSAAKSKAALAPTGAYLTIMKGGPSASERVRDLPFLTELIEAGKLRSVIDRSYPLEQVVEAHRYAESGQKQGSVVVTVS